MKLSTSVQTRFRSDRLIFAGLVCGSLIALTGCGASKKACVDQSPADGVQCDMNTDKDNFGTDLKAQEDVIKRMSDLAQSNVLLQLRNWKPSTSAGVVDIYDMDNSRKIVIVKFDDIGLTCPFDLNLVAGQTADDRTLVWMPAACSQLGQKLVPPVFVRTRVQYTHSIKHIAVIQNEKIVYEEDMK